MRGIIRADRRERGAWLLPLLAGALVLLLVATARAAHLGGDVSGHTTLEQRLVGDGTPDYQGVEVGPGEPHVVREGLNASADPGRGARRVSELYFAQLSDFQLVDEESPARVEFLDPFGGPLTSAFRPMEAFTAHAADQAVRQVNEFAGASPVSAGDGSQRPMDFALTTGDSADNQQYNETEDVVSVLAGGPVDPNSGVPVSGGLPAGTPATSCTPAQAALLAGDDAEAGAYTGVQDYDDYATNTDFYDPDDVQGSGPYQHFPSYPGLMDRAQAPFTAEGLAVPGYVTFGNHDALAQGNEDTVSAIEEIMIGCTKPTNAAASNLADFFAELSDPGYLPDLLAGSDFMTVHPDPDRRAVSKAQYKALHAADPNGEAFGFAMIDPAEEAASNGAAGYYSFAPAPGFRFIALDTLSEGGVTGPSAEGNIDDPQFQWLAAELDAATAADELIVLFSHHGPRTLNSPILDEQAAPCSADDSHGHDVNPGCDVDPRSSAPIHTYDGDVEDLLFGYDNVIAWVNGHSHVNSINPESDGAGGGFWDIRTAAEIDWPQQSRLIEIFDNDDGTLSIFGTILDHSAPTATSADGADASGLSPEELASIGRELSFNDPQTGSPVGEGDVDDRNVELLISDPREGDIGDPSSCTPPTVGTNAGETLIGDAQANGIRARGGADRVRGRGGNDCLFGQNGKDDIRGASGADTVKGGRHRDELRGGKGSDRVRGGPGRDEVRGNAGADRISGNEGRDEVYGGRGSDHLRGGAGRDRIRAGKGRDRINVRGGGRDIVNCGAERDFVRAGRRDTIRGNCERVQIG